MATSNPPPAEAPAALSSSEEDENADLPLTMAASVVLENLPKDAQSALATAGEVMDAATGEPKGKVKVRLTPLPSTPTLRPPVFNVGTGQRFEFVVRFLRKRLQLKESEGVFCYVNSVFAPGLDEGVGNLWRCFKTGDELVVAYSVTQAFG